MQIYLTFFWLQRVLVCSLGFRSYLFLCGGLGFCFRHRGFFLSRRRFRFTDKCVTQMSNQGNQSIPEIVTFNDLINQAMLEQKLGSLKSFGEVGSRRLITRRPAKPINALGSAKITSPRVAKLAITPAMVGLKTEM